MTQRLALYLAAAGLLAAPAGIAENIATFEFTGSSLVPTLGSFATANGITVSDLSTGNYGNLFDNGGSGDHLRISGDDNTENGSGTAFTNGTYLSFTVTIPDTVTIDLTGLSADVHVVNAWTWSSSRIFSSVQGFDAVVDDTIGAIGSAAGGDLGPVNQFIDLADPGNNADAGANVSAGDFDNLTDTTVTFYLPWTDNSTSNTRYTDLDNLTIEGGIEADPVFGLAVASPDPDLAFDTTWSTGSVVTRTLVYEVGSPGGSGTVTIDDVVLTDDAGTPGSYTLGTITPSVGTTLNDGETVSIEVTATGIASGVFAGSLFIDTTSSGGNVGADDNDTTVPIFSTTHAAGDKLNPNPFMDTNLDRWGGGSTHVTPGIAPGSAGMARVKGEGDPDGGNPDSLYQANGIPDGATDWELTCYFTPIDIANFGLYVDPLQDGGDGPGGIEPITGPDGDFTDRTFQWVLLGTDADPPNPVFGDTQAANTIINLAYLPDGNSVGGTPDFYVYDAIGGTWVATGIGAIQGSVDNDTDGDPTNGFGDGLLDTLVDPADVINVYKLSVKGTGFGGGGSATYDITVTKVSGPDPFTSGSATGLGTFHDLDGSTSEVSAFAFLTSDDSSSSNVDAGFVTPFWTDDACFFNVAAPDPGLALLSTPSDILVVDPDTAGSTTFTIRNDGGSTNLDVSSIGFSGSGFSITSPGVPFSLAPGTVQEVEVTFDSTLVAPQTAASGIMTINSNDPNTPALGMLIEGGKSSPGQLLANWDLEVPGAGANNVFAIWSEEGSANLAAVPGLTAGSTTAAYINRDASFSNITQAVGTPVNDFTVEFDFAVKDSTERTLQVVIYDADPATNSRLSIRYQGGIWSAYDGAWQTLIDLSASPLTPSEDNDGNGSLDDPGDVKVVYTLRITGSAWGSASPTFGIEVLDSSATSLGSASGLGNFHFGNPTTAGLGSIELTCEWVNNPGFWADSIQVSGTVAAGSITLSNPVLSGSNFSVDIEAGVNIDIYRSATLLPGGWGAAITTNVAPGPGVLIDSAAPVGNAFYIAVPTGEAAP